jgi:PPK2 family polyphosphate:nucleotide phosphotransferase
MKTFVHDYRLKQEREVNLKRFLTLVKPIYASKDDYQNILANHVSELSRFQNLHFSLKRNALLLIFQGMDAAGKDGTIKHLMSGLNPQGCQVHSFMRPTTTELNHDFLWRTSRHLPERGQIGIFNRSSYEEVIITRVHQEVLDSENLENDVYALPKKHKFWAERYQSINEQEAHLHRNGTRILKFFLHISPEEQTKRLLARLDDPTKNWKLTKDDLNDRDAWKSFQKAYEKCLAATSTTVAPWYLIPADDKLNARLLVSKIILDAFASFNLQSPRPGKARQKELDQFRKRLKSS